MERACVWIAVAKLPRFGVADLVAVHNGDKNTYYTQRYKPSQATLFHLYVKFIK
jgi:hypothetical protein